MGQIIFITGTDTGVGKTVCTALLLARLRAMGIHALGVKPFCSGSRADAELLLELNERELRREVVNPFYFPEPVAPFVAAQRPRRHIRLKDVAGRIHKVQQLCDVLLVEGAGGLFVPLGRRFMIIDLIGRLNCPVLVVAPNRVGVLNQMILSTGALRTRVQTKIVGALMGQRKPDFSVKTNAAVLRKLVRNIRMFEIPFLPGDLTKAGVIRRRALDCGWVLHDLLAAVDG